jgi:iron complex outermembrane receptor protein
MKIRLSGHALVIASTMVALVMPVAYAQDLELEEVVVTARKREESLQEVPISISAFTQDTLQQMNLRNTDELGLFTPGFSFTSGFGRANSLQRPTVRGITTIINGVGNASSAAAFVDGIYVGGSTTFINFDNIERIEVLKGPQAAQFGRGTYAGAINYVTRKPSDEFEGSVRATGGEHSTFEASAYVSGPIVEDKTYFALSASHKEYGGEWTNLYDGDTIGGEETQSFSGRLMLTPTDNLEINVRVAYEEGDDEAVPIHLQSRELNNVAFRGPEAPRAREYYAGTVPAPSTVDFYGKDVWALAGLEPGFKTERTIANLDIAWDFAGGYELKVQAGMNKTEWADNRDGTYGAYDFLSYIPRGLPPIPSLLFLRELFCASFACGSFNAADTFEDNDRSFELRVTSPGDRSVRWTGGVYYYDGDAEDTSSGRIIPPDSYAEFNHGFGLLGELGDVLPSGNMVANDIENLGIFGGVEWDINDNWRASLEARWSEDNISVTNYGNLGGFNRGPVLESFSEKFDSFTPRVTVSYAPNDDTNYFVSVAQGNKPGNFNSNVPTDPATGLPDESFRAVEEEDATTLEIGYKASLMDGRATFNAAAYFTDITDQQLTTVIELPDGNTASILQNVGKSEVLGLELEYNVRVSESLRLAATYAYVNSEYKENISADQADLLGSNGTFEDIQRLGSVAGNTQPRSPEHMASLFMRWDRELQNDRNFYVSGTAAYESSKFNQEHNLMENGDRTIVGLTLGLEADRWDANLWVKNLFDDDTPIDMLRYIDRRFGGLISIPAETLPDGTFIPNSQGASTTPRGFGITMPRGRQMGATVTYRF